MVERTDGSNPNATVSGREHRQSAIIRQALLGSNCRNGVHAKAIDAVKGCHPDVAFSIFEKAGDVIPGEAIGMRKSIRTPVLVNVYKTMLGCADPQAAVTVSEHSCNLPRM